MRPPSVSSPARPVDRKAYRFAPPSGRAEADAALRRIGARRARFRAVLILVSVVLVVTTAVVILLLASGGAAPRPELAFLQVGTLERTHAAKALLIRDETVYAAPAKGVFRPMAAEGARVPALGLLAYITPKDGQETLRKISDLEQQIADLQRDLLLRGKGSAARTVFSDADQSLSALADVLRRNAARGTLSGTGRLSSSIGILIARRNGDLSRIDFQDASLDGLLAEKATLEADLGLASTSVAATRPGIVSYATDGLEAVLLPAGVDALTAGDVLDRLSAVPARVDAAREVEAGAPVLKTIEGPYQYFAMVVSGVDASAFREGASVAVRFPSSPGLSIRAVVFRSRNAEQGLLLVLRTDLLVERFSDRRTEDVLLVRETDRGLKVEVASFVSYDSDSKRAVVKIVQDGYVRLSEVKVVAADRDEAIVEALPEAKYPVSAHAVLVVDPDAIAEGDYIG